MKNKFHISVHRNSDNIHLKLFGDFNGSSAWELNNMIERMGENANKIFVHTESLESIDPFGEQIFHKQSPYMGDNLIFTGKHAPNFQQNR